MASGEGETASPKTKNAASQWSKRKRITHPVLEMEDGASASSASSTPRTRTLFEYSTPPRHCDPSVATPALTTCSPDSPALVDALKMAARPLPSGRNEMRQHNVNDAAELPQTSYSSSIEAMAAFVEASRSSQQKSVKRLHSTKQKRSNGSDTSTASNSIGGKKKQSSFSIKTPPSSSCTGSTKAALPVYNSKSAWMVPIIIILFFLLSEVFLGMLVFYFKDSPTEANLHIPQLDIGNVLPLSKDDIRENSDMKIKGDKVEDDDNTESISLGYSDNETVDGFSIMNEINSHGEIDKLEQVGEFKNLQSMLNEGFDGLTASIIKKGGHLNRKSVESKCGHVWVVANDHINRARSDIQTEQIIRKREMTPGEISLDLMPISWETLALDAQHCLGGAGLAFLDKDDLDTERLRLSAQVFDRLVSSL